MRITRVNYIQDKINHILQIWKAAQLKRLARPMNKIKPWQPLMPKNSLRPPQPMAAETSSNARQGLAKADLVRPRTPPQATRVMVPQHKPTRSPTRTVVKAKDSNAADAVQQMVRVSSRPGSRGAT